MKRIQFNTAPADATPVQRRNFLNVQIDAVGIGLASAASPFLPVFLTRLGATNVQVGMLTSMPAITGLFLAILVGNFLQTRKQIVPWFSIARLLVVSCYAATGLAAIFVPREYLIVTVLGIWALATLPQTVLSVSFSVVMNAVAGPAHRYELMSRRWSILGVTTSLSVAAVGQVLDWLAFPLDFQVVFLGVSVGGLVSYWFSSHIELPDTEVPRVEPGLTLLERIRGYGRLVLGERAFVRFSIQRFAFLSGTYLLAPIVPLYLVREVDASDAWIGMINTVQTAVLMIGYMYWTRQSRKRGSRYVLLATTLALSIYPALLSTTQQVSLIVVYAGLAGIFQAGADLVFFDELMRTVPEKYSATFVSLAQSLQFLSAIFAPLIGTSLASVIGLGGALLVAAGLRFAGFALFFLWRPQPGEQAAGSEAAREESAQVLEAAAEEEQLVPGDTEDA